MSGDWRWVKVAARRAEAQDIIGLELVDPNGKLLPAFTAGSHIDLEVAPGLVRQYSLCNSPAERSRYQIGVLLEKPSRGGSAGVHERLIEGVSVRISQPRNQFALHSNARHTILLGGGIGVTPLLSMVECLAMNGESFEMHYCTRTRERAGFLRYLSAAPFRERVSLHFDDGADEQKLNIGAVLNRPNEGIHLYVCGPAAFMEWVQAQARAFNWPESQVHREYFAAPASLTTLANSPFTVRVASTRAEYQIPADRSVVAALAEAGIVIPTFCEQGVCGTCCTRVLAGIPDHRDTYLTEEERASREQMIPCVSRALSECLELDL